MKKLLQPSRIMYLFVFIILCLSIFMNIKAVLSYTSFIPNIKYIKIIINNFSMILCLILIIKPDKKFLAYILFFIQAINTAHVGFIGIGTQLFAMGIVFCFLNGEFMKHGKKKIVGLSIYWFIVIISIYFSLGLHFFILEILLTGLYLIMFFCVYEKIKSKLVYILPTTEVISTKIELPPKGVLLKLSDYGLSERQIAFVIGSIKKGETYETLAERYHVSISVVKKDMAAACKQFGVTNREALRILLLQYKIE